MIKKLKIFILASILVLLIKPMPIFAQISSSGIAIPLPVNDETVQDGDVICSTINGNVKCSVDYAPSIAGIYSANPSAEIIDPDLSKAKPIITEGVTAVRVSAINGNINEGSFITTSQKAPGLGVLATDNGYVIGTALESYNPTNKEAIGKISVAVNIHLESSVTGKRNNLMTTLRRAIASPFLDPIDSLRYILAVLIVIVSFVLGLIYFGRASRTGIEAIGRNPLAKNAIQTSIVLHVLLSMVIILIGVGIAYLVLIL
jgi:F0F1-type ATP synthase membrane subunit c/vacuolar-type H+-ATPase subunit K